MINQPSTAVAQMRDLFAYNRWANERLLRSLEQVHEEEFTRDLGSSYPSIRDTLCHLVATDWVWLNRWRGYSPNEIPDYSGLSSVTHIRVRWDHVEKERSSFLTLLTEEELGRELLYRTTSGKVYRAPLWQLMRHVVNHSTYHRGQVTTMLRQLGRTPVATDLVLYHRESASAML